MSCLLPTANKYSRDCAILRLYQSRGQRLLCAFAGCLAFCDYQGPQSQMPIDLEVRPKSDSLWCSVVNILTARLPVYNLASPSVRQKGTCTAEFWYVLVLLHLASTLIQESQKRPRSWTPCASRPRRSTARIAETGIWAFVCCCSMRPGSVYGLHLQIELTRIQCSETKRLASAYQSSQKLKLNAGIRFGSLPAWHSCQFQCVHHAIIFTGPGK